MTHEMEHADSPTWCIHCGKFDCYCRPEDECRGRPGEFDSRTTEGHRRIAAIIEADPNGPLCHCVECLPHPKTEDQE